MNLILTRRGRIPLPAVRLGHDEHQCGLQGTREVFYRVELYCTETALDHRGFLVDQLDVHQAILDRVNGFLRIPSCERLAMLIAEVCQDLCPRAWKIVAKVGASKLAWITCNLDLTS